MLFRRISRSSARVLLVLMCSSVVTTSTALAQPRAPQTKPVPAADAAEAKRRFGVGLGLFKEGAYEAAASEFDQSYKLGGRPTALRNLAQSYRELKRFGEAYEAFSRLLSTHAAQLKAAEKQEYTRVLDELRLLTGSLLVSTTAGAEILIDGQRVGVAPVEAPKRVNAGGRKVRVTLSGFEPFEQEFPVGSDENRKVEAVLQPEIRTGRLVVRERSGAAVQVYVDDKEMGPAPWEGDLPPGPHAIELKGPKASAPRQMVDVALKGRAELVIEAVASMGKLRVSAAPVSATITIDGNPVGVGLWESDVGVGSHQLVVSAPGHSTNASTIDVLAGHTILRDVTLQPIGPVAAARNDAPTGDPFTGIYVRWLMLPAWRLGGTPAPDPSPESSQGSFGGSDTSTPYPAGATSLGVGYSFGFWSLEAVGSFAAQYTQLERTYDGSKNPTGTKVVDTSVARTETYDYLMLAGFGGLGGRITSPTNLIRFTFGAAFGVSYKDSQLNRDISGDFSSTSSGGAGYVAPGFIFDGGILLGSTPGVKFSLGALCWLDFAADDLAVLDRENVRVNGRTLRLNGAVPVTKSGPNVLIGPAIGLQFGH
jgi:hypothetical protein